MKGKRTTRRAILTSFLFAICVLGQTQAFAAWGDYDTTFGFLGAVIDPVTNHYPQQIAVQPDGKILITGSRLVAGKERFFLRRYLSNGQLDTSFGNNGAAISNAIIVADADYCGNDIIVQVNGKITVVGTGNGYPTIWRFSSSGNGDPLVGIGGMKTLSGYRIPSNLDSAGQDNAAIIGVGKTGETNLFLVRLGSNGSLDSSFGTGGESSTNLAANLPHALKVETPTGKILAGGVTTDYIGFGIARWSADGIIDNAFIFANEYSDQTFPSAFAKLADGRYVMPRYGIGNVGLPSYAKLAVLGTTGLYQSTTLIETLSSGYPTSTCPNILGVQQDGRLVVKGLTKMYRFDTTLSTKTSNTCSNYASLENETSAILQADDKMLAAGRNGGNLAMIRTLPN